MRSKLTFFTSSREEVVGASQKSTFYITSRSHLTELITSESVISAATATAEMPYIDQRSRHEHYVLFYLLCCKIGGDARLCAHIHPPFSNRDLDEPLQEILIATFSATIDQSFPVEIVQ